MLKQKKVQTGSKPKTKDGVVSKIEITIDKGLGLVQYRLGVKDVTRKIAAFAIKLSPNLLTVKMGLMGAVQEVERKMKENRE